MFSLRLPGKHLVGSSGRTGNTSGCPPSKGSLSGNLAIFRPKHAIFRLISPLQKSVRPPLHGPQTPWDGRQAQNCLLKAQRKGGFIFSSLANKTRQSLTDCLNDLLVPSVVLQTLQLFQMCDFPNTMDHCDFWPTLTAPPPQQQIHVCDHLSGSEKFFLVKKTFLKVVGFAILASSESTSTWTKTGRCHWLVGLVVADAFKCYELGCRTTADERWFIAIDLIQRCSLVITAFRCALSRAGIRCDEEFWIL